MEEFADGGQILVPVRVGADTVYVSVHDVESASGDEYAISGREHRFDGVLDGVAAMAREAVTRLRASGASKVAVEFGVEVAVETGKLVAVLGKASSKSTMTVTLEWDKPTSE